MKRNKEGQFIRGAIPWNKGKTYSAGPYKDITGNKYGRLTVLRYSHSFNNATCWECQCVCGNVGIYYGLNLKSNNTTSCGCYRKEISTKNNLGENCIWWKGGLTNIKRQLINSRKYRFWRISVYERDDYTCRICNVKGGKLNAHHISSISSILFSLYEEWGTELLYRKAMDNNELWDIDNGITLCRMCHTLTDNYGKREYQISSKNLRTRHPKASTPIS